MAAFEPGELKRTWSGVWKQRVQLFQLAQSAEDVDERFESGSSVALEILKRASGDTGLTCEVGLRDVLIEAFALDPRAEVLEQSACAHGS